MSSTQAQPFDLLLDLEQRYRRRGEGGADAQQSGEVIAGRLVLRCGPWFLSLTMDQVAEIMPLPRYTRVPGVRAWLLGIANLRGRVITVVDLGHFLRGEASRRTAASRIIVAESEEWRYGLLVDEVIGLRHFSDDAVKPPGPALDSVVRPYVMAVLQGEGKEWLAFNINTLLKNEKFLDASV